MRERHALEQELRSLRYVQSPGFSAEREILHSPDQRARVTTTDAVPFRWICHVELALQGAGNATAHSTATGLLVGPRHVLTAAHTLRSNDGRFTASSAWVYPGRNGNTRPFGRVAGSTFRYHVNWFRNGAANEDYDYGMIVLDDAIGERSFRSLNNNPLGWWGHARHGAGTRLVRLDPATLDGRTITVAGYPEDKTAGTLWSSTGQLTMLRTPQGQVSTQARRMAHSADTHRSQSGAPVWMEDTDAGVRHLVGIHTGAINVTSGSGTAAKQQRLNMAIRITREVVTQLKAWM
jgi:glutamyl endopeptidase